MKLKDVYSLQEKFWWPRQHIKKQRYHFVNKGPSSQGYGFSSGHVWIWELDCEERWTPKNWCFWTVVLEKTLESPLGCKEIQPVHPKGDQSWVFIGETDAEAETPILWPPDGELTHWKKDWCWEGLGAGGEEDDREWDGWMASLTRFTWVWANSRSWWWAGRPDVLQFLGLQRVRHNWATELTEFWDKYLAASRKHTHETPGGREGQGSLAHCRSWGCKESDMTEQLNRLNFETNI